MVKEAALIATRNRREEIKFVDFSEAIERIELGLKHKRILTPREKEMVAYHESGHLITTYLLHPTEDVFKASIVSRRHTLGVVWPQPREELYTQSKEKLLADVKEYLSGYAAEKLKFNTTADGVWGDFKQATTIAHAMVWMLGMSEAGFLGDYTAIPQSQLSDSIKEKLNNETDKIFKSCLKEVEELLKKERPLLDRFAKELIEREELDYDEIDSIFKEYGKMHTNAA